MFLGVDYNFSLTGSPILWKTMVFDGPLTGYQDRCAGTPEQAEAMHAAMVARVRLTTLRSKKP